MRRACCRVAYLRGALVAAGSVSGPGRDAHLELRAHERHAAETGPSCGSRRARGIALAVRERPDHAAAYAKRHETIADLLALLGAGEGALVLAEADVVARKREVANRQTNAETANLRRQVAAAGAQLDAIAALRAAGALEGLPAALLVAAALREEHREATLGELRRARRAAARAAHARGAAAAARRARRRGLERLGGADESALIASSPTAHLGPARVRRSSRRSPTWSSTPSPACRPTP